MSEREVFSEMEMHYEERRKRVMKQHKTNTLFLERGNGKMKHSRTICLVIDYTDWRVDSGNEWNLSGCSAITCIGSFQRDRSQDLLKPLQITNCPLFIQRKRLLRDPTQKLQPQPSASRSLPPPDDCTLF